MMPFRKCECCNKSLPLGSTKYTVRVEVTSEFDGFLPEHEGADEEACALDCLLAEIENMTEEELEEDVHVELEMTLCSECKSRLLEQMENYSEGGLAVKQKQRATIH